MMQDNNKQTTIENNDEMKDHYEEKMLEAFTGKPEKVAWYRRAFDKYDIDGVDALRWHWSWWAFFGGFWFLLYRKAYLAAFILFIVIHMAVYIPVISLMVWIATGGLATYFVYKVYKEKKFQIEAVQLDDDQRISTMRRVGGYHRWVIFAAVAYYLIVILGVVSQVAPELIEA